MPRASTVLWTAGAALYMWVAPSTCGAGWPHIGETSEIVGAFKIMVEAVDRVQAVICASEHEAAWLERNLLSTHKPRANRSTGGQEVPVLLALSASHSPGLKAVYRPCPGEWRHFGPYLGGDRARLALSGDPSRLRAVLFRAGLDGVTA